MRRTFSVRSANLRDSANSISFTYKARTFLTASSWLAIVCRARCKSRAHTRQTLEGESVTLGVIGGGGGAVDAVLGEAVDAVLGEAVVAAADGVMAPLLSAVGHVSPSVTRP